MKIRGAAATSGEGQTGPEGENSISKEESENSIEQLRKRFVQDSREALRSFLKLQKRSRMLQVESKFTKKTNRYLVELE